MPADEDFDVDMGEEELKRSAAAMQEDVRLLAGDEVVSEGQLVELRDRIAKGIELQAKRRRKQQG